jgi:hypothetical protein
MGQLGNSSISHLHLFRCLTVHSTFFRLAGKQLYRNIEFEHFTLDGVLSGAELVAPIAFDPQLDGAPLGFRTTCQPSNKLPSSSSDNTDAQNLLTRPRLNFKKYLLSQIETMRLQPHYCDPKYARFLDATTFPALIQLVVVYKRNYPRADSTLCESCGVCPILAACNPETLVMRNLGPYGLFGKDRYSPSNLKSATFAFPSDARCHGSDPAGGTTWSDLVNVCQHARNIEIIFRSDAETTIDGFDDDEIENDPEFHSDFYNENYRDVPGQPVDCIELIQCLSTLFQEGKDLEIIGMETLFPEDEAMHFGAVSSLEDIASDLDIDPVTYTTFLQYEFTAPGLDLSLDEFIELSRRRKRWERSYRRRKAILSLQKRLKKQQKKRQIRKRKIQKRKRANNKAGAESSRRLKE